MNARIKANLEETCFCAIQPKITNISDSVEDNLCKMTLDFPLFQCATIA